MMMGHLSRGVPDHAAAVRDPGYTTVHNTNRLVRECLVGLAMREKGIDEEHYLSPLTVDDGRN